MSQKDYLALACDATLEGMKKGVGGPFGATVVRNGEVIVAVSNTVEKDMDPTAHAEVVAVREACKKLNTLDLSDCEIYATCEPCPMCVSAMMWAKVKKVYYCTPQDDVVQYGFSDAHLKKYISGENPELFDMVRVERRDDCDHIWDIFKEAKS